MLRNETTDNFDSKINETLENTSWPYINELEITLKPGFSEEIDNDYIKNMNDRQKFEITIDSDGKCYNISKQLLKNENILFVVGQNKKIYGIPNNGVINDKTFHHSYLVAGESVLAAGFIVTNRSGVIEFISNNSGHYKPTLEESAYFLKYLYKIIKNELCLSYFQFENHSRCMEKVIEYYSITMVNFFDEKNCQFVFEDELETLNDFIISRHFEDEKTNSIKTAIPVVDGYEQMLTNGYERHMLESSDENDLPKFNWNSHWHCSLASSYKKENFKEVTVEILKENNNDNIQENLNDSNGIFNVKKIPVMSIKKVSLFAQNSLEVSGPGCKNGLEFGKNIESLQNPPSEGNIFAKITQTGVSEFSLKTNRENNFRK